MRPYVRLHNMAAVRNAEGAEGLSVLLVYGVDGVRRRCKIRKTVYVLQGNQRAVLPSAVCNFGVQVGTGVGRMLRSTILTDTSRVTGTRCCIPPPQLWSGRQSKGDGYAESPSGLLRGLYTQIGAREQCTVDRTFVYCPLHKLCTVQHQFAPFHHECNLALALPGTIHLRSLSGHSVDSTELIDVHCFTLPSSLFCSIPQWGRANE